MEAFRLSYHKTPVLWSAKNIKENENTHQVDDRTKKERW